nr:choice-of-anchor L domain-containing protein [Cohnella sp. CFH 77786]
MKELSGLERLVLSLLGNNATYSNITFKGEDEQAFFFNNAADVIGIGQGVILSTGYNEHLFGMNQYTDQGVGYGGAGDPDLDAVAGVPTEDAAVLEFDFVPSVDVLKFRYVFASDEYNEDVNNGFNDAFGIFLNGANVALLDDGTTPVTIDNVNRNKHSHLYVDNEYYESEAKFSTEMDGFTKVLTIEAKVNKGVTNHLKLAIADAGDDVVDSNVFIETESLPADPPVIIQFSQAEYAVEESGEALITVTRSKDGGFQDVNFATSDGTATAGQDYKSVKGFLEFEPGETSQTFAIPITDDALPEGDETIQLTLSDPSAGAELGTLYTATLTIHNDLQYPAELQFSKAEYMEPENNTQMAITVTRSKGTHGTVSVDYATSDGSATAGQDYVSSSGTLVFAPGEIYKIFTVPIKDDILPEGDETVLLKLSNPTGGAVLGTQQTAKLTIKYDSEEEPNPTSDYYPIAVEFANDHYVVDEGSGTVTLSVVREDGSFWESYVEYCFCNQTAVNGKDYYGISGTLKFDIYERRKTITVKIVDDEIPESLETFGVFLRKPGGGWTILGPKSKTWISIVDNDSSP